MKQPLNKIFHLKKTTIDNALDVEYRQYFIGTLGSSQILNYIELGDFEMGTSFYKEPKADVPHMHSKTSEVLYILKGTYAILTIDSMKEYLLNEGDVFVIPPNMAYASKAHAETQVLFVKTGGNDKISIPISPNIQLWLDNFLV